MSEQKRLRGRPPVGPDYHIRIPTELADRATAEAEAEGVPFAEIIRRAVRNYLEVEK